jgi:23S rRNA pseudouridine1911/1915/1917 synthase
MDSLLVAEEWAGCPLDELLAAHWPRVAKGRIRELVRAGRVTVDGLLAQPGDVLRAGQMVILEEPLERHERERMPAVPVEVLHEDEHLLAIQKPPGLPVEPSRWGEHPVHLAGAMTTWAQLRAGVGGADGAGGGALVKRPRALHRLDLGTSGVLLFALALEAERFYRGLFAAGAVEKVYHAIVLGRLEEAGVVDAPIGPDERRRGRMRVDGSGKPAQTAYAPLETFRAHTLVEARPRTGRTHQIRVHLAHAGHPLAVDTRYGGGPALFLSHVKRGYRPKPGRPEKPLLDRLSLHARSVRVPRFDAVGGAAEGGAGDLEIVAPYPDDFARALKQLRRWSGLAQ